MAGGLSCNPGTEARSAALGQDLVRRAAAMAPTLREREAETRRTGQVSDETIAEFVGAGFYKVLQPKAYGGYELPPKVYVDIARQLASGCMASAWVYGVVAVHNWQMGLFDDRAAQEVWGKAIYRGNAIQNAFLDIHTAHAHVANNPFPISATLGRCPSATRTIA